MEDAELLARIATGDQHAIEILHETYLRLSRLGAADLRLSLTDVDLVALVAQLLQVGLPVEARADYQGRRHQRAPPDR